jgi:prepilin-type N-terminal cleavage/methylation domain-containing protein
VKNRNSGFTLVELIVVVLVVGLVVLIFTQIPLFGLSSWTKGSERLKLQRDANLVMIKIQRKLRPASSPIVEVSDPPTTLVIDGESFVLEGDTGTQFFDVTSTDGVWNVNLTLVRGGVQTTLRTAVKPRN